MSNTVNDFISLEVNDDIRKHVSKTLSIIQKILLKTKQKERTKKATFFFTFVKNFSQQGVQGIVGVVLLKKILKPNTNITCANIDRCASSGSTTMSIYFEDITNNQQIQPLLKTHTRTLPDSEETELHRGFPLVFKIAVDISNMILHEKNIAQDVAQLSEFCPHFVNLVGNVEIPISSGFVEQYADDSDDEEDEENECDCENCQHLRQSEYESHPETFCSCCLVSDSDNDNDDENSEDENDDENSDDEEDDDENSDDDDDEESMTPEEIEELEKEQKRCEDLFYDTKESFPRTILFYEKINNFPLHRLLKKVRFDNSVLSSQILQILMALEIAQNQLQFTHYDLHTANILEQRCEFDAVFLYNLNNKKWIVPTYGYYPKIIDLGSSFSSVVNKHPMLTHANSYDYGFQSQIYDKLNDIHHSIMSLFYYIEPKKSIFETLYNKFKYIFHHVPVLSKSGWKQLPYDLTDTVLWKIKKDCLPEYELYHIFREFKASILENMNAIIVLPFEHGLDSEFIEFDVSNVEELDKFIADHPKLNFKPCFHPVMAQLNKMFADENICGEEILFILREFFHVISKHKQEVQTQRQIIHSLEEQINKINSENETQITISNTNVKTKTGTKNQKQTQVKSKTQSASQHLQKEKDNAMKKLQKEYTQIKHELSEKTSYYSSLLVDTDVDYVCMIDGFIDASKIVQTIYYLLAKRHSQIIQSCYEQTIPSSPIDMFFYVAQNFTPNFYLNPDTVIYYWDVDNKKHKRIDNCWNSEFNSINNLPFVQKADAVYSLISHKL